jgi:hypothetical protein
MDGGNRNLTAQAADRRRSEQHAGAQRNKKY